MGLFDLFKKPPGAAPRPPSPLLAALIERFGLQKKPCPEASLMGDWWEGRH